MLPAFITPLVSSVVESITGFIPNPNERAKAKENMEMQLITIITAATQGQLEINKTEAAHNSIFVAGWRPFIGWVCGVGVAWQFVLSPLLAYFLAFIWVLNPDLPALPALPVLDITELMGLVFTLLGMGGLRTFEKMRGVSREK